jgi:60S ribosome subunit biogenesis protein NIP7
MRLRELSEKEKKVIRSALRFFDSEEFLRMNSLAVFERDKREVFSLSPELHGFLTEKVGLIESRGRVISAGLKIGEVGKRFRFSLEGSFFLSGKKKRVYVNRRGEMLFLYGRDIFSGSVVKATSDVRENDTVFVSNTLGDVLGIGRSRYDAVKIRSVEKDKVVVENLVDRGEYLRKKKQYSSF